eukprot:scaffold96442_cov63-Phaeocystis_antarctica.AAC.2
MRDWRDVGNAAGARRPRRGPARRARLGPARRTSAARWSSRRGRAGKRRPLRGVLVADVGDAVDSAMFGCGSAKPAGGHRAAEVFLTRFSSPHALRSRNGFRELSILPQFCSRAQG